MMILSFIAVPVRALDCSSGRAHVYSMVFGLLFDFDDVAFRKKVRPQVLVEDGTDAAQILERHHRVFDFLILIVFEDAA